MNVASGRSGRVWSGLMFGLLLLACGDLKSAPAPSVGSNSNWLKVCDSDADCGGQQNCQCGLCSLDCRDDEACRTLPDATCAERHAPALIASCGLEAAASLSGRCLPRCEAGGCEDGHVCVDGACVAAVVPDTAFCAEVAETTSEQRAFEDQILALVLDERVGGNPMCAADEQPNATLPGLRVDPRLTCAARLLARDMNDRGAVPEDRERWTLDHFRLAGYEARLWGVNFAMFAETPDEALRLMHNDRETCRRFTDARFRDIGVANDGDAYIVTIAVQQ